MSNVKIYTVDDEEPNCNRCDHVCDSDIVCQQYCGNEHYWNGYSRTEFIEDWLKSIAKNMVTKFTLNVSVFAG